MARKRFDDWDLRRSDPGVSDWFRQTYPDATLGDLANYYRSMQQQVPYAPAGDGYDEFYERMTGETLGQDESHPKAGRFQMLMRRADNRRRRTYVLTILAALLIIGSASTMAYLMG
jgi:hypothetical protein